MDRRKFLVQVAGQTSAAAVGLPKADGASQAAETRAVSYQVRGFTCITCAVGLEVMLKQLPGVTRVKAAYPANTVAIGFDEHAVAEKTIKDFISKCGFSVA